LKDAPVGSGVAERVTVLPMLRSVEVIVKLIHVSAVTVWFAGVVSVGGTKACTLTVKLAETLALGETESVTVKVA
jgi:hypothetical protein